MSIKRPSLSSSFILTRYLDKSVSFPPGGRRPHGACFFVLYHFRGKLGGVGSVVSQKKHAYSPDTSYGRLWILGFLEILASWHILAAISNN